MDDDNPQNSDLNASQALSATHDASTATTTSTDAPRGFVFCFITLITTFVTLINVASWPVILGLAALFIPLTVWYLLHKKKQPKLRHILSPSGAYVGYFILLIVGTQVSRFWEPGSWAEVAAKWVLVFAFFWFCISRVLTAMTRDRLREANERYV